MDHKLIENFIRYFEDKTFDVMYNEDKKDWSNVKLPKDNEIAIPEPLYPEENYLESIAMEICDKYTSKAMISSNPKLSYLDGIVNAVVKQVIEYTHIEDITDIQPYMMPMLRKIVYGYFTVYPNSTGDSKNKAQPKQLKKVFQLLGCETIYNEIETLQRMMPTPIVNTFYSKFRTLLSEYGQETNKYINFAKVKFTYDGKVHTIDTKNKIQGEIDKELYYSCYKQCKNECKESILQALLIVSTSKEEFLKYSSVN